MSAGEAVQLRLELEGCSEAVPACVLSVPEQVSLAVEPLSPLLPMCPTARRVLLPTRQSRLRLQPSVLRIGPTATPLFAAIFVLYEPAV